MEKIEIEQIKNIVFYCDICNQKTSCGGCKICKKDLCRDHMVLDNHNMGDYPDKFCQACWQIGKEYREKIQEIQNHADEEIDNLNQQWIKGTLK